MKKTILLLVVLSFTAIPAIGRAESRENRDGSSRPVIIAGIEKTIAADQPVGAYNPAFSYPGIYERYRLYKKYPGQELWRSYRNNPAKLFTVTCGPAKQSLSTTGTWTGNLNKDGSCGPLAEPALWATGNYLNFEATPDEP